MSKFAKRLRKFLDNPGALKYFEIETLLLHLKFEKYPGKGSHVKFKHKKIQRDLTLPIHNNDLNHVYKKYVANIIKTLRDAE